MSSTRDSSEPVALPPPRFAEGSLVPSEGSSPSEAPSDVESNSSGTGQPVISSHTPSMTTRALPMS